MNLAELAINKRAITYFATVLLLVGGIFSYFQLGQLEDPEFTVKTAAIITSYPGASAKQVELEITDRIETKLQEMSELKNVYSSSRPGLSIIKVDIKNEYWADRLPQVWDVMRKKVQDIEGSLPPGSGKPQINDDFGYVFGFLLAVTGDGFSYAELESHVKSLRKDLNLVPGVARIDFWGVQDKRIFIDIAETQMTQLGITKEDLYRTLSNQNIVVDGGNVDLQDQRFRVAPTGEFTSPEEIADLAITSSVISDISQTLQNRQQLQGEGQLLRIRDIGTVSQGYLDPPNTLMRFNRQPGIVLALAPLAGVNSVEMGRAVDQRLQELQDMLPVGVEVHKISWQSDIVDESINGFMINLAEAIVIVLIVLAATMGLRVGALIGISGLVFPILGTFAVMAATGVDLQRVSLGALIIAMGMMVDNAIVIVDGFVVRLQQGMDRTQAAIESATVPAWPLLGATVVACMAFYPIYASTYDTGEYAGSLFTTVATSLLFSWLLSQTITPLMCITLLPDPKTGEGGNTDPYASPFYQRFRKLLTFAIDKRVLTTVSLLALLVLALAGFRFVPQMYFPDSSRTQFMIDYWLPQGTRIEQVSDDLRGLEAELLQQDGVTGVSAFIGSGPPRFYLPVDPEDSYSSYGQLIVNTETFEDVDAVMAYIDPWAQENRSQAMVRVRKYGVGAFDDWKVEARFSGPAEADPQVLRDIAARALSILEANPNALDPRTDWRQKVRKLVPEYNQERARWAGVSRDDLASATKRSYDGVVVGQYREGDDLIPIVVRNPEAERKLAAVELDVIQIIPSLSTDAVPVSQVVDGIGIEWEEQLIWRWDRRRAISVQASPDGVTATALRDSILADFEAIELPPGYTLEWDGEYDSSLQSQQALVPGMVPTVVIMTFVIVLLFNAFRPPIIIFAVIPFVVIGITFGLLITQVPFGFIALLGAMSLSGMMIKNSVVLLDQVNINIAEGMDSYTAVIEAAVSRLRPVMNAAATTIFGLAPLLTDIFWVSMAVTIMFGLAFGTLLTMVLVPVLYAMLFRLKPEGKQPADERGGVEPAAETA
jgi:multidrug efflux pump subunit AcrB